MRVTNNIVALLAVLFMIFSLVINIATISLIDNMHKGAVGKAVDGKVKICFNNQPELLGHDCNMTLYAKYDGNLRGNYNCSVQAADADNQTLEYTLDVPYAEINPDNGSINISGNIRQGGSNVVDNITLPVRIFDGTPCNTGVLPVNIVLDDIRYYGGVILLQNYTSNGTHYLQLREGYTTFHRSLDDYFRDIDGYPLTFSYEFFDLHCFNIEVTINPITHLVVYRAPAGSNTDITGPCHARFRAENPYGFWNETNIFEIYIERSTSGEGEDNESDEGQDDQTSGSGGGGGGSGGSGGGSTGSTGSGGNLFSVDMTECRLWNVNCTEWSQCIYNMPENSTFNLTEDGVMRRDCIWSTNCPGEMEPEMEKRCDYKPTCSDNMMNCHEMADGSLFCEQGVDCGGPCPACPSCEDFIKNQGEIGIDCGGPCPSCPTCTDNILNCHRLANGSISCELDIDCGGPCPACPTCDDGIKNCHRLENGSLSCEEGIDCGGPCERCISVYEARSNAFRWLLNLLLIIIILLMSYYPLKKLYKKAANLYMKLYMKYIKKRILHDRSEYLDDYLATFDRELKELSLDFDAVTAEEAKRNGDMIIEVGESTGYNVDRYSVSFDNDYAVILQDNSRTTINYAMYMQESGHGRKLLSELMKHGIKPKYRLCKRSSTVLWDPKWGYEKHMKYERIGGKLVARTVEYIISFQPSNTEEANKIVKALETYGKGTQRDKITGAWDVPDIRVTGTQPVMDYEKSILNARSVGGQKLLILTKDKPLPGFEHSHLWLNKGLAKFIK